MKKVQSGLPGLAKNHFPHYQLSIINYQLSVIHCFNFSKNKARVCPAMAVAMADAPQQDKNTIM